MHRSTLLVSSILSVAIALPALAHDHRGHHDNMSVSVQDDDDVLSCDDVRVRFDDEPAVRAEEQVNVSSLRSLRVYNADRGGIRVQGWSESGYAVTACKAGAMADDLRSISVSLRGNEVTAKGPDEGRWMVYFIVRAPHNAVLDLESENSPIGVKDVDGTITARVSNGPLSIKDSSGKITAESQNGPLSFSGGSGTVSLNATNGPLSIKLSGASWNGSLQGGTENGPLSLKLPRRYGSGVVLRSSHGPVSCRAEDCATFRRNSEDDDDERRIELGKGPVAIRLSTNNGPLSVKED
jgi:hypothetical protein